MAQICADAGPWFIWQLRDAAAISISSRDPVAYNAFFEDTSNELSDYCLTSGLCSVRPLSIMLPPFNVFEGRVFIDSFFKIFNSVIQLDAASPNRQAYMVVDPYQIELWDSVIKNIEVYWEDEQNKYAKESTFFHNLIEFLRNFFSIIFIPLILYNFYLLYRIRHYKLNLLFVCAILVSFGHFVILSYADSHAGAIGLGRTTYLLESTLLFYSAILIYTIINHYGYRRNSNINLV
jgi:hypothetical protein